jgi:hypothetical protein
MSWADFYRRRDALNTVIEHARADDRDLAFASSAARVEDIFGTRDELLLALHYKWTLALTGQLGVALAQADRDPEADRVDAVLAAWRATAAEHDVLRRLLDAHADEPAMRTAIDGEQRLLALSAGLAELHESELASDPLGTAPLPRDEAAGSPSPSLRGDGLSAEEVTRVGGALLALARNAPERVAQKRRGPVEQLLRRLVASA